jgi:hypothetical protein
MTEKQVPYNTEEEALKEPEELFYIQADIYRDIESIKNKISSLWEILEDTAEEENLFKTLLISKTLEKSALRMETLIKNQIQELQEAVNYTFNEIIESKDFTEKQREYILREWAKI